MFNRSGNKFETSRVTNVDMCYIEWSVIRQFLLIPYWTHFLPPVAMPSTMFGGNYWEHSQNCEKLLPALSCLSVRPHGNPRLPLRKIS